MKKTDSTLMSIACGLLSLSVVWGLWELVGTQHWSFMRVFPPPSQFLADIIRSNFHIGLGTQSATVQASIISSISRVFGGMALGFFASVVVGFSISISPWTKRFILPLIQVLAPIAPIAWIPLAIVMLGIGNHTALFIVFMGVFFTLTIATVQAVEMVPEHLHHTAITLGANRRQIWQHVVLPHILPSVFTILRLNFIAAWMAVLAAEMTGLRDGLGAIINVGRNLFDYNLILLGMSLIGLVGFLGDATLRLLQRKFFWWGNK